MTRLRIRVRTAPGTEALAFGPRPFRQGKSIEFGRLRATNQREEAPLATGLREMRSQGRLLIEGGNGGPPGLPPLDIRLNSGGTDAARGECPEIETAARSAKEHAAVSFFDPVCIEGA